MNTLNNKILFILIVTLFLLTILFLHNNTSYAAPANVPKITDFSSSSIEENALTVTFESDNTGVDYNYELLLVSGEEKIENNLAAGVGSYTYQNLEEGNEYEVIIRACGAASDNYSCTAWSNSKKATAEENAFRIDNPTGEVSDNKEEVSDDNEEILDEKEEISDDASSEGSTLDLSEEDEIFESDATASGEDLEGEYDETLEETTTSNHLQTIGIKSVKLNHNKYVYNGKVEKPKVIVIATNGKKLTKNTHYKVSYSKGRKNIGSYKVIVKGKGSYSFTEIRKFKIIPGPSKINTKNSTVTKNSITVSYNKKSGGVKYRIRYKKASEKNYPSNNKIYTTATKAKITGLAKKTKYDVEVLAYKKVGKTVYYGKEAKAQFTTKKK